MRGGPSHINQASNGVSVVQMNFRSSETTWILCHQELLDRKIQPDVILIQDPPFSVCMGKNIFRGYRAIRPASHGPCHVVILIREGLRFQAARPFGRRVVGVELKGNEGPVMILSAYIRHTTGRAYRTLLGRSAGRKGGAPGYFWEWMAMATAHGGPPQAPLPTQWER